MHLLLTNSLGPFLSGGLRLPGSHTGGAGSLRPVVIPLFGDHRFSIGYDGQTGCLSCHHLDGRISTRDLGGIGSCQASEAWNLRGGLNLGDLSHWIGTILREDP